LDTCTTPGNELATTVVPSITNAPLLCAGLSPSRSVSSSMFVVLMSTPRRVAPGHHQGIGIVGREMGRPMDSPLKLRARGERYLFAVPSNTVVRDIDASPP
jgi:hypothetical protein